MNQSYDAGYDKGQTKGYVTGKSVIVTGAGSGFGRLIAARLMSSGAKVTCVDIDSATLMQTVKDLNLNPSTEGIKAQAVVADVTDPEAMQAVAKAALSTYETIDVLINNAGVMPLALFSDHDKALELWHRAIDINIKGALNGIAAVYDQMIAQSNGHIINISSIYGNHPTYGAGVYGATKAALNFISESLRVEARGKIKVSLVKPTGVSGTGLSDTIVNREGVVGILGHNLKDFQAVREARLNDSLEPELANPENTAYVMLAPEYIADAVMHVINQPDGVAISDVTVRATGDHFIL